MRNPQAVSNFYEENLNNFRSEIHATIPSVSKRVSTGPILLSRISSFPPRSIYGREWFLQITLMIVMVQHPSASQFVRCSAKGHTLIQALHPSFSNRLQSYNKIFIFTTKSTALDAIPQHPGHTSIFFNQKLIAVDSIHLPLIT